MPPPTESTRRPPEIIGAGTKPRARVRGPSAQFIENRAPGWMTVASRSRAARRMLITRGWPAGNGVANEPTTSGVAKVPVADLVLTASVIVSSSARANPVSLRCLSVMVPLEGRAAASGGHEAAAGWTGTWLGGLAE